MPKSEVDLHNPHLKKALDAAGGVDELVTRGERVRVGRETPTQPGIATPLGEGRDLAGKLKSAKVTRKDAQIAGQAYGNYYDLAEALINKEAEDQGEIPTSDRRAKVTEGARVFDHAIELVQN